MRDEGKKGRRQEGKKRRMRGRLPPTSSEVGKSQVREVREEGRRRGRKGKRKGKRKGRWGTEKCTVVELWKVVLQKFHLTKVSLYDQPENSAPDIPKIQHISVLCQSIKILFFL